MRHWLILAIVLGFRQASLGDANTPSGPIDLVRQAEVVVQIQLQPSGSGGPGRPNELPARILGEIKGRTAGLALILRLEKAESGVAETFRAAGGERQPAVLFAGRYRQTGAKIEATGLIHLAGHWYDLRTSAEGEWTVVGRRPDLRRVWNGASAMLARLAQYIVADPEPFVPQEVGVKWGPCSRLGIFNAPVHGAAAVDLGGDGKLSLFIASESGDRVYRWQADKRGFGEITASIKLASRSRLFAWGDFDGDGRVDLASFDGHVLTLWAQGKDATFAPKATDAELPGSCLGLAPLDVGLKGRPGILVSTDNTPLILVLRPDGVFEGYPVAPAGADLNMPPGTPRSSHLSLLGRPQACLVADFDGDGICDILQPFARGSLFYKGRRPGSFAPPVMRRDVAVGEGPSGLFLGDFDADGLLDIFVAGEERCMLWQNLGGGRFAEATDLCGELAELCRCNGLAGAVCDINNDGWQDAALFYTDAAPQIFFNRGFRNFGQAASLDLSDSDAITEINQGTQAGTVADLTASGAQAMAMVLKNGELWVVQRDAAPGRTSAIQVVLPPNRLFAGPMSIKLSAATRSLGTWNILPGLAPAFIGCPSAQAYTVQWRWPGGAEQTKPLRAGPFIVPMK